MPEPLKKKMKSFTINNRCGVVTMITADGIDLGEMLGVAPDALTYKRASHVEVINAGPYKGRYLVDVSPLGEKTQGVMWPPYPTRAAALAAEHVFVDDYYAGQPVWSLPVFRAFSDMTPEEQEHYRYGTDSPLQLAKPH